MRLVVVLAVLVAHTHAKVYTRCNLAWELKCKYDFPSNQLADWICLVAAESSYNTAAVNVNKNGSKDYGLFQINDYYWCKSGSGSNDCGVDCARLLDPNIAASATCAKKIYRRHGFAAWYGWRNRCRGKDVSGYIADCNLTC